MLTMLREPSVQRVCKLKNLGESYVPEIPLSDYAAEQYNSMKLADTGYFCFFVYSLYIINYLFSFYL